MASTRNKNNFNNYCHSQAELQKHRNYVIQPMKRMNDKPAFPKLEYLDLSQQFVMQYASRLN